MRSMAANPIPRDSDFVPDWARDEAHERARLRRRLKIFGKRDILRRIVLRRANGESLKRIADALRTTGTRIHQLLQEAGFPELTQERCRGCSQRFSPGHGKQQYHDPACAARASWKRFAPKRKRDYHAEYVQRVKRAARKKEGRPLG